MVKALLSIIDVYEKTDSTHEFNVTSIVNRVIAQRSKGKSFE